MHTFIYQSPLGVLSLAGTQDTLQSAIFVNENNNSDLLEQPCALSPLFKACSMQLDEYFAGKRTTFDLPLALGGTAFQKRVWDCARNIPYGQTITYAFIANQIGNPKAARAVARALSCNPLHIIVPCHRVVGSDGALTGYRGGLARKKALLALEASK